MFQMHTLDSQCHHAHHFTECRLSTNVRNDDVTCKIRKSNSSGIATILLQSEGVKEKEIIYDSQFILEMVDRSGVMLKGTWQGGGKRQHTHHEVYVSSRCCWWWICSLSVDVAPTSLLSRTHTHIYTNIFYILSGHASCERKQRLLCLGSLSITCSSQQDPFWLLHSSLC